MASALQTLLSPSQHAGVRKHRPDYMIVLYVGLLMLIGLIVMYAIGPARANVLNHSYETDYYSATYFFVKQAVSLLVALAVFLLTALLPYTRLYSFATKLLLAGLGLSVLLLLLGNILHIDALTECTLGACRWFRIGPFGSFQPAEFLKFSLLLFMGVFLGRRMKQGLINDVQKTLIPAGALMAVIMLFVVIFQKDMGTGIVMAVMFLTMLLMAGVNAKLIGGIVGVTLLAGVLLIISAPHRMERVATYFQGDSTTSEQTADNYHIKQAKIAIGTGGLFGVGIGNSIEATGYLPEAINDSVFAIMGEMFGFIGLVLILALFTGLLLRLLKLSDQLRHPTSRLVVVGIFTWMAAHTVINIAAMTGVFPLTGITLPLLSFGGSSVLFSAGALGLAFQLSAYSDHSANIKEIDHEDSRRRRGVGRTRYAGRRSS